MSAQGRPKRESLPLGGTARSAKGAHIGAQGRPKRESLPLGGTARGGRVLRAACVGLLLAIAGALPAVAGGTEAASRVPRPNVAAAAPGKCVEDTPYMLRNHMDLLKHHRDQTVRDGVRTTRHSLANCVACHASKETGRVTGSKDAFCEGCHQYAAVKLDCFECHADRPATGVAAIAPAAVSPK